MDTDFCVKHGSDISIYPPMSELINQYKSLLEIKCFDQHSTTWSIILAIVCFIFIIFTVWMIKYSYKAEMEVVKVNPEAENETYCVFSTLIIRLTRLSLLIILVPLIIQFSSFVMIDDYADKMFNSNFTNEEFFHNT